MMLHESVYYWQGFCTLLSVSRNLSYSAAQNVF